jgi:hypothetical protein
MPTTPAFIRPEEPRLLGSPVHNPKWWPRNTHQAHLCVSLCLAGDPKHTPQTHSTDAPRSPQPFRNLGIAKPENNPGITAPNGVRRSSLRWGPRLRSSFTYMCRHLPGLLGRPWTYRHVQKKDFMPIPFSRWMGEVEVCIQALSSRRKDRRIWVRRISSATS